MKIYISKVASTHCFDIKRYGKGFLVSKPDGKFYFYEGSFDIKMDDDMIKMDSMVTNDECGDHSSEKISDYLVKYCNSSTLSIGENGYRLFELMLRYDSLLKNEKFLFICSVNDYNDPSSYKLKVTNLKTGQSILADKIKHFSINFLKTYFLWQV